VRRTAFRGLSLCLVAAVLAGCGAKRPARHQRAPASPAHRQVLVPPPLRLILRPRTVRLPILMYHRVDTLRPALPAVTQRLTVDPRVFERQMTWLKRHGFHAVTELQAYAAIEQGRPLPPRPVLITFDDGYRDVLSKAAPILRRLHMHATAYVITGRVSGPDPSFLTWPELRRLRRGGFDVGSHTVTHRDLRAMTPSELQAELVGSRRALERRLHTRVQWFAYPFGRYDARVVAAARSAGYVLAVTTNGGDVQNGRQPLELQRYEVLNGTDVGGLLGR
jgi:peptidoglycan/xylan/chitin deacetylase (PgdA/CDA1 family)